MLFSFFFNDTATTEIYTLSLHDALPIFGGSYNKGLPTRSLYHFKLLVALVEQIGFHLAQECFWFNRSEEHTSELQSRRDLVCRLLLEKKKTQRSPADCGVSSQLTTTHLS